MGWKWDDIVGLLEESGVHFSEEQLATVEKAVTSKKWELVDILEGLANDAAGPSRDLEFGRGRKAAFEEVIAGVRPHGARPA